jgi:hypothetical protein
MGDDTDAYSVQGVCDKQGEADEPELLYDKKKVPFMQLITIMI